MDLAFANDAPFLCGLSRIKMGSSLTASGSSLQSVMSFFINYIHIDSG